MRYCARKPVKALIILVVFTIMATVVMATHAVTHAAGQVSDEIDAKTGQGFVLENNPQNNLGTPRGAGTVKRADIEKIAQLDRVQDYVARQNVTADLVGATVQKLDRDDYDSKREAQFGNAVNVWGVNTSEIANNFRSGALKLSAGRHLRPDDKNKALIHEDLAKANNLTVGSTLTVKGNKYDADNERQSTEEVETEIVGLFSGKNTAPVAQRSELYANTVFTDLDTTRALYQFTDETEIYQDANFFVAPGADVDQVVKDAAGLSIDWKNYQLSRATQYFSGITGAVDGIKSVMRKTTTATTIVAAAIVMLILFLWLNERHKETGTLLSLGVTKASIVGQYLAELLVIAVPSCVIAYGAAGLIAQSMGNATLSAVNAAAQEEMSRAGQFGADMESAMSTQTLDSLSVSLTSDAGVHAAALCLAVIVLVVAIAAFPMMRKHPRDILVNDA